MTGSSNAWKRWGTAIGTVIVMVVGVLGAPPASAAPAAPGGLSPAGSTISGTPVLQWNRVSGATSYSVEVAQSSSFDSLLWKTTTTNRRATPTLQLPAGDIWWRVRGVGSSGAGSWSTASYDRNRLAGPTLTAPASTATLAQPMVPALLAWTPVSGAIGYTIEISTDSNFVDPSLTKTYTTKTSSFVVPSPQVATEYYWHVRATLASGIYTDWSESRIYTTNGLSKPELTGPSDSALTTIDDVVLDWKPVLGAKTYDLQVSTDENFLSVDLSRTGIKGTRFSPPTTLGNDQYYWRVRPIDVQGNALDWVAVDTWTFRRAWPEQPHLEYPANDASVGDPFYYEWTPVKLASNYTIELSRTADFNGTDIVDTCTTVHTTYIPTAGDSCWPGAAGTYYWRVYASDSPKVVITDKISAETHRFTYYPDLVPLVTPVDGGNVQVPTLRWDAVAGAAEYRVTITAVDGGSGGGTFTTSALSYTPRTRLTVGKEYRWQVQTVSESGRVGTGLLIGSRPTFTVEPMDTPTAMTPEPTSPGNGAVSTRFPTLTWTPVTGATSYRLYVRPFDTPGFTQVSGTFGYPAGEDLGVSRLAAGTYEWKVEAYGNDGFISDNYEIRTFTIQSLPAVTGHRVAITGAAVSGTTSSCQIALPNQCEDMRQTPVLRWAAQPEAGYYRVWLSRDKEMTNLLSGYPVTVESNQWISRASLIDSQAGSAFFWFVQPCKANGACSPLQHAGHAFSKKSNQTELLSPIEGAVLPNDVTFTWRDYLETNSDLTGGKTDATGVNPRIEARQYRIQVSLDPNFQTTLETAVVDQRTFTSYANTYPEGRIYWRVQAIDGSENYLTWSEPRSFVKASPSPVLRSPVNGGTISHTQPLVWNPLDFAASYDVEVYKNDDKLGSSANLVVSGNSKQVAFSPSSPLPVSSTPYRWRVRRVDASGRKGAWSKLEAPEAAFRVVGSAPALVAPSAGTYVPRNDALFAWKSVDGATSYRFERRATGSSSLTEAVTTAALAWAPTQTLADGTWEWRVTSLDAAGKPLATSAWRGFAVDSLRPTVTYKSPLRTASRTANFTVKFSERVRNVNSSTIKIYKKGVRLALSAKVTLSSTGRTATLNPARNLRAGSSYTVRVSSGITDHGRNRVVATAWSATAK